MKARAYGKINLTLEVIGKSSGGYHEIKSVFQRVSIYDEVELRKSSREKIEFSNNIGSDFTTVHKALKLFFQTLQRYEKIMVVVKKNIPVGSGLGGGSSDAAVTLNLLNSLFDKPLSEKDLFNIAKEIGSDVPFFLNSSTAIVEGRGDVVHPLQSLKGIYFLLVFPEFRVSTGEAYTELDKLGRFSKGTYTERVSQAIERGKNYQFIKQYLYNEFEVLYRLKDKRFIEFFEKIESAAHLCFHITGSGSSIFVISDNVEFLKSKQKIIEIENPGLKTLIVETI